jgi:chemotaxis-related protein WspB
MLFLLFHIGNDRYALDAGRVVEVLPLLTLKLLPQAPKGVAGLFNYRGQPVPAVDLSEMTLGRQAVDSFSTRIILVRHPGSDGQEHLLGLIAEQATETLRTDKRDFKDSGVHVSSAPYLGPVLMDPAGPIQWIQEQRLLPAKVRDLLFAKPLD